MNINHRDLQDICKRSEVDFSDFGTVLLYPDNDLLIYQDNHSPVLAVAHLDTVQRYAGYEHIRTRKSDIVKCTTLDDRLGAYIITNLLPEYNINVDVLLTTGEEWMNSTALLFESTKQYNWMVEFDRGGDDIVFYQYDTKRWNKLWRQMGYKVGIGSYSDIADLDSLHCLGANIGIGYYNYHSVHAYADLNITRRNCSKFTKFYHAYKDKAFPYNPRTYNTKYRLSRYSPKLSTSIPCDVCWRETIDVDWRESFQEYMCDDCFTFWTDNEYGNDHTTTQNTKLSTPRTINYASKVCDYCGNTDTVDWYAILQANLCDTCAAEFLSSRF